MPDSQRKKQTLYAYPPRNRLRGRIEIARVYDAKIREGRGPLLVYALPNELGHPRLGLSVSTRVGNAAVRNRVKRMLRESFRLMQHDLPTGYDLMVVVKPHKAMILAEFQNLLMSLVVKLHHRCAGRFE